MLSLSKSGNLIGPYIKRRQTIKFRTSSRIKVRLFPMFINEIVGMNERHFDQFIYIESRFIDSYTINLFRLTGIKRTSTVFGFVTKNIPSKHLNTVYLAVQRDLWPIFPYMKQWTRGDVETLLFKTILILKLGLNCRILSGMISQNVNLGLNSKSNQPYNNIYFCVYHSLSLLTVIYIIYEIMNEK